MLASSLDEPGSFKFPVPLNKVEGQEWWHMLYSSTPEVEVGEPLSINLRPLWSARETLFPKTNKQKKNYKQTSKLVGKKKGFKGFK